MAKRRINVRGSVISVTYPGASDAPNVVVSLQVGTAVLRMVFMSRRHLSAIDIGQELNVRGNLVTVAGAPTLFNPTYTILAEES
ncbi:RecG-like helicase [Arcanobacterium wilhelmae]|uniref:RecG-like helicase n=1 Tax=Arcanobacterium wilhelmae TaxID=1803177 RepID=A0ABT9N8X0_9ACTO|nr:hypothetical protein [Arcanobacterium wilhelmae]MDP9800154.1 RecG-like helicase [Arcanobacterium wilhelmae]WFN89594.1 hypothetical protein P8A24_05140 [Arcanobacterium wilhelmae]